VSSCPSDTLSFNSPNGDNSAVQPVSQISGDTVFAIAPIGDKGSQLVVCEPTVSPTPAFLRVEGLGLSSESAEKKKERGREPSQLRNVYSTVSRTSNSW